MSHIEDEIGYLVEEIVREKAEIAWIACAKLRIVDVVACTETSGSYMHPLEPAEITPENMKFFK